MNHWIALYLSGQYPQHHKVPNRLQVLFNIRRIDGTNFSEENLGYLKDKGDLEFYNTLLDSFQEMHGDEKLQELLDALKIPDKVRRKINMGITNKIDLQKIESILNGFNEEKFSRFLVMPILQAMGYEDVEYKGKVNETDSGLDFYPVKYTSPSGIVHYAGVQVKARNMTNGDSSASGDETNKLIAESKSAFGQPHKLNTGEEVRINELLVFNSHALAPSAKEKFFNDGELIGKRIKYWAKDGVISLLSELEFKKDYLENLEVEYGK